MAHPAAIWEPSVQREGVAQVPRGLCCADTRETRMPETVFRQPSPHRFVVERLPDGSAAVFDQANGAVHSLNEVAALVWDACAEPITLDALVESVQQATPPKTRGPRSIARWRSSR